MDQQLIVYLTDKPEFIKQVNRGLIEANSLTIGLIFSCKQKDISDSFDLLDVLALIATSDQEDVKTAAIKKYLQETREYLSHFSASNVQIAEKFITFSNFISNTKLSQESANVFSQDYSEASAQFFYLFNEQEIFSMILKALLKNRGLLRNFLKDISNELVESIDEFSKIHYLAELSEFNSMLRNLFQVFKRCLNSSLEQAGKFVLKKISSYLNYHKNENLDETWEILTENKGFFNEEGFKNIMQAPKINLVFHLGKSEEPPKSIQKEDSKQSTSEKHKMKANEIKVSVKPYDNDDTDLPVQKGETSFFDSFHFRSHLQVEGKPHSHAQFEEGNSHEKGQKTTEDKGKNRINIKALPKPYDEEEKDTKSGARNPSSEVHRSDNEKSVIGKVILKYKSEFEQHGTIKNDGLLHDLNQLKSQPGFSKSFFLEMKNCIQNDERKSENIEFWKSSVEVSKEFIETHQVNSIKKDLFEDDGRAGNYNRRGRRYRPRYG